MGVFREVVVDNTYWRAKCVVFSTSSVRANKSGEMPLR